MDCQPAKKSTKQFKLSSQWVEKFLYDEESIAWFESDKMNRKIFEELVFNNYIARVKIFETK